MLQDLFASSVSFAEKIELATELIRINSNAESVALWLSLQAVITLGMTFTAGINTFLGVTLTGS